MGKTTSISWTGATWNCWQGCRRKSEGCRHCYMFRDKARYGQDPTDIHRSAPATFRAPLRWQREVERGERTGTDCLVFTCSWSDWFIKEADAWRDDAWAIVRDCPGLIFQILTKRADRMTDHLPAYWPEIRDRCWLGVSAEDQRNYDQRRPYVDADLAPVMWWSLEPLLGPISLGIEEYKHRPAWVVVGGESGDKARPMHPQWARSIRDECRLAGVAFHFKQHGEWIEWDGSQSPSLSFRFPDMLPMVRVGKKAAGRLLDGVTWDQLPFVAEVAK
jgi:protein gp37